jgi:hypothetical protein
LRVLRHEGDMLALHRGAASLWKLAQADLPALEKICREELDAEEGRGNGVIEAPKASIFAIRRSGDYGT